MALAGLGGGAAEISGGSFVNLIIISVQGYNANSKKVQLYDPVFILRFSIHSLAMEYIEPLEFASLGLLAITFISLSSPDADTRKLGYEAVVRFKSAVEVEVVLVSLLFSSVIVCILEGP